MRVGAEADCLTFDDLRISFHRTLRIPDDGRAYPLPPGLGGLPIVRTAEYLDRLPGGSVGADDFLIPMYQREALWLGFDKDWPPVAISVALGTVNAVSGRRQAPRPSTNPQDYLVVPEQVWLDGINVGPASVRQFVAMPLGQGYTVEGAITGLETHGGIQIAVWPPRPGVVLERPPRRPPSAPRARHAAARMGLGAGGRIEQKIYPDPHGVDVWDVDQGAYATIHIVNSDTYREITGRPPPPTPIDATTYTAHGLPWFEWYEEHAADVEAPASLKEAKTVAERDRELGLDPGDRSVDVDDAQVTRLRPPSDER
jgi:hypothetical protein